MLERIFKLNAKKTNVKTEVLAGITTFLAMAYILGVNPSILAGDITGMDMSSVFLATAISSAIACILMGVLANYPIGLAPGMGVNALFTYTVCLIYGYTYQEALCSVLISGLIFLVISITGIRKLIIDSIPKNMKLAIGAGIGFFIAFIALKNAGIIVASDATFVALGNFKDPAVLLAIFGIVVTMCLMVKKVNAAPFYGLIITAIVGIVLGMMGISNMPSLPNQILTTDYTISTLGSCFSGFKTIFTHSNWFIVVFSFLFVDFFDTAGTLVAVGNSIGLVDENGKMENIEKALLADSVGTVVGAIMGTSTVTSFVESGAGVAAGGRTGLTAVTCGICFILSIFISPVILSVAVNAVTAPAIFVVGILMAQQLKDIEWQDVASAASAFVTIIFMVLAYSISDGLALGFIVYGITMAVSGKAKQVSPICWVLIIVFILYFCK
ncbi:MAG: NCS2 family permease [Firmicutes bacterium]|nr:NCS2 family permease [Erysipelotrichaceae bacterium]MDD6525144.1 NCS2 family permease [Bacillota bacterium]MDY4972594.1 NCS2 family permease [Erysipelotrichaceae bacterium]MDY5998167.1 NCS2 family permease [Erysipelotrichaceae bacterium]